ncbi:pyruvate kinase [Spiroplasma turonicum]|uniref:Pyruvate kinase n=1 Tax=Spiroplasma turonicum TaxID=216946 RepID=A0A0K1P7A5_9MOLU|nr:pyruvate kinase [Spiroplasma turonicum]AKU80163.1 pyruvate kinase [Spiroplasma turonicum]ALX71163.1 pyruvate kinase [Spiroplasma turonicum]
MKKLDDKIKRTKIITTLGPSVHSKDAIKELFDRGMNTIRLNFSHADFQEHGERIEWVKELRKEMNKPISILLDTKGPEIRIGKMKDGKQLIKAGTVVTVYTDPKDFSTRECSNEELQMSYDMSQDLKPGDSVLVDDGKLTMFVEKVEKYKVICKAFNTHVVKTNKRVNLPGIEFTLPFLAEKDYNDIKFGIEQGIDYIAASFVNSADNVNEIREILKANDALNVQIISKIESQVGCDNIDSIIEASDGIMVARGDLGLEIPYYEVPYWEKQIIRKCREKGKIVIVATQMLESMTDNPQPTRAEVTDVYYATELGADATMLSGESANGDFPFITVETMATINKRAEMEFYSKLYYEKQLENAQKTTSGKRADIANQLANTTISGKYDFAVVASRTGELLKTISKFRPNVTILGVCDNEKIWNAFGAWHSIFMNKVNDLNAFISDEKAIIDIAKSWGVKEGTKILFVRNENIKELQVK